MGTEGLLDRRRDAPGNFAGRSEAAGSDHETHRIHAFATHYPFEEEIRFTIQAEQPVEFPLSLRIPVWCREPQITINGSPVQAARTDKGFVVVHRTFRSGDRITLTPPMQLAVSRWPQNGIGIERGPLVYSLPIRPRWTSKVIEKYSTAEFPAWEATPESDWNYGLAPDEPALEKNVEVKKRPISPDQALDPWEYPPVALSVPARKIAGWELEASPEDPAQKFTPCLPDLSAVKVSEAGERIVLEPYGSTHLRVTVFPRLKA